MTNSLLTPLNTLVFPFADTTYYGQSQIIDFMSSFKLSPSEQIVIEREFLHQYVQMMRKKITFRSVDELQLLLNKFHPYINNFNFFYEKVENRQETSLLSRDAISHLYYGELLKLIRDLSHTFLTHLDGRLSFKYWNTTIRETNKIKDLLTVYPEDAKLFAFHRLGQIIYLDIISIMYFIEHKENEIYILNGQYQNISLVDAPLHDVFEQGLAENHVHASSAFNFSTLWYLFMNTEVEEEYFLYYRETLN